ncbi:MAG: hypothetical protein WCQ44_07870, partial [Opitutaceae bacterium]
PSADALKNLQAQNKLTPLQAIVMQQTAPAEELYNLARDPGQQRNLALDASPPAILTELRITLNRWTEETGDTVPVKPTPTNVVYETGIKTAEFWRGDAPGAATHAAKINRSGPVRNLAPIEQK